MSAPTHIAFIPDGNRRKAVRNGISVAEAYLAGAQKGVEVVGWCQELELSHVSFFGASHENILLRPRHHVTGMFGGTLRFCQEVGKLSGVNLHVFGDIADIGSDIPGKEEFLQFQRRGRADGEFVVHVAVNYSATVDIRKFALEVWRQETDIMGLALNDFLLSAGVPDVDLLIRTGGRQRLSGFLPYQLRYSELWFTPALWSDFSRDDLSTALEWFSQQDRNFGE